MWTPSNDCVKRKIKKGIIFPICWTDERNVHLKALLTAADTRRKHMARSWGFSCGVFGVNSLSSSEPLRSDVNPIL
jgi:hypothetical protein